MRYFQYTDYGFPDAYAIVIDGNEQWMADHPEQARKFVQALQRGYQFAADKPDEAAQILIDANPGAFTDESLVRESQRMLAAEYMKDVQRQGRDADGRSSGRGTPVSCSSTACSPAPTGQPLTTEPDWSTYFTNEYLDSALTRVCAPRPRARRRCCGGCCPRSWSWRCWSSAWQVYVRSAGSGRRCCRRRCGSVQQGWDERGTPSPATPPRHCR